jgi:hypothetical protein
VGKKRVKKRVKHIFMYTNSQKFFLGKTDLTQPLGVLGHCLVEKQMIVGLRQNQMGWSIAAECFDRHAG